MKYPAWSVMILSVASCVASANTTVVQTPNVAAAQPAAAAAATKDAAANVGQCYALDAAARHECIYAVLVKSRLSKSESVN